MGKGKLMTLMQELGITHHYNRKQLIQLLHRKRIVVDATWYIFTFLKAEVPVIMADNAVQFAIESVQLKMKTALQNMLDAKPASIVFVFDGKATQMKQATQRSRMSSRQAEINTFTAQIALISDLQHQAVVEIPESPIEDVDQQQEELPSHVVVPRTLLYSSARYYFEELVDKLAAKSKKVAVQRIRAPVEADSQLAWLAQQNLADIVISGDSDMIVYSVPCQICQINNKTTNASVLLKEDIYKVLKITNDIILRRVLAPLSCDYFKGMIHDDPMQSLTKGKKAEYNLWSDVFQYFARKGQGGVLNLDKWQPNGLAPYLERQVAQFALGLIKSELTYSYQAVLGGQRFYMYNMQQCDIPLFDLCRRCTPELANTSIWDTIDYFSGVPATNSVNGMRAPVSEILQISCIRGCTIQAGGFIINFSNLELPGTFGGILE